MDKRAAKKHKRQVARAQENKKLSEPDVRTPEQVKAAREASKPTGAPSTGSGLNAATASRGGRAMGTGSAAKTDA
ncbi:MAG: hypothetical protein ABI824_12140 [Acidobacteriota bacterium]